MDADTYPREDVKKFLGAMIVMKINPEAGKEQRKVADQFDVNSYPRLIVMTPKGEILEEVKGSPKADAFERRFTVGRWNEYVAGQDAKPPDHAKMAKNLFTLATWYPQTEYGVKAAETAKAHMSTPEFKTAWDELQTTHDRESTSLKADAQLKLGKKKEAIETYKDVATRFPGTKEGDAAAAALKKLGVKLAPAGEAGK